MGFDHGVGESGRGERGRGVLITGGGLRGRRSSRVGINMRDECRKVKLID